MKLDNKTLSRLFNGATHIGAWLPLIFLLIDHFTDDLTADPIREITLRTGKTALVLLILSLAVTPLMTWLDWKFLTPSRRPLGLYAFGYVCLHLLTFVYLDYGLQWAFIIEGIVEKRYALVGFTAWLLMIPLAITSTKAAQKKMGKRWKSLHKLAYVSGILAIIHYVWLVKNAYTQPVLYGSILFILLLARWQPIKQRIIHLRQKLQKRARGRSLPTPQR
ncbi:MAG: sulfoxide reductase heme-binding subunit YedZ [Chloroflexi bacterium]|nr:sulfoxide reductase heme-binding subunit YedZ [Chloroflexota bacterium]MBP8059097.1 sulfoxide reductase heme-binding subunit YedZ [Chloroflexota bacterium]